jgi:protein-S-isoprenylcysteine O-methyltransferase Ste14
MKKKPADRPKVLLFPPLIPLGVILVSVLLGYMLPAWGQTPHLTSGPWLAAGIILGVLGLALVVSALVFFKKHGTPPQPHKPAKKIVSEGPYGFTRNPMYLGGNLILLGLSFLFYLPWVWGVFLMGLPLNHWGVVLAEEEYLEKKFGKRYLDYKKRVRRWI